MTAQAGTKTLEQESKLPTTSVHRIVDEDFQTTTRRVVVQCDISDPTLHAAVTGHLVNGAGLCPYSIYGYGAHDFRILQVTATTDLGLGRAELRYASVNAAGLEVVEHARCIVEHGDATKWLSNWAQVAYLVRARVDVLHKAVDNGGAQKIKRGLAYKLFSALIQYQDTYRGMEEVILDSTQLEATSRVSFQSSEKDGKRVGGLKFQRIPRSILDSLLPPDNAAETHPRTANPRAQPSMIRRTREIGKSVQPANISKSLNVASPLEAEKRKPSGTTTARALDIIIAETKIANAEFQDECVFADFGIDSLLSLTIAGRKELGLDVPGSLFLDHPTVASLHILLSKEFAGLDTIYDRRQDSLALEEISGPVDLGTVDIDSLITISILGSLREDTGLSLPSGFFFGPSVHRRHRKILEPSEIQTRQSPEYCRPAAIGTAEHPYFPLPIGRFHTASGKSKNRGENPLLFPDGSGSATSYATIPDVSSVVCAFGLNCPFMTRPQDYTCGIERVSELYLSEVQRRQPSGQRVERLVLFDSPCPIRLEALPSRLHHFFNTIGLLGTGNKRGPPDWLLPHFESSIKSLTAYQAQPMDPSEAPKTFAIWARDGVCKNPTDPRPPPTADDPKSMKWLLNNRTDFGYNGWDDLLGAKNITTTNVAGNHFTMMREPLVRE
ncbi:MAG: hypothetical protein M1830_003738 [Pleopsidium flavum]|nr:MAG: hypothetical protein M1830_003738 [Pleopsidium flavum]